MEKEFVPPQPSLDIKELGFKKPCLAYYSIDIVGETIPRFRYNNRISEAFSVDEGVWFNHNLDKDYIWSAPTFSQCFRFFREKYNLDSYLIEPTEDSHGNKCYRILGLGTAIFNGIFDSYEKAELECLKKLIEIVKNKSN